MGQKNFKYFSTFVFIAVHCSEKGKINVAKAKCILNNCYHLAKELPSKFSIYPLQSLRKQ
jgi:hypothetical protein